MPNLRVRTSWACNHACNPSTWKIWNKWIIASSKPVWARKSKDGICVSVICVMYFFFLFLTQIIIFKYILLLPLFLFQTKRSNVVMIDIQNWCHMKAPWFDEKPRTANTNLKENDMWCVTGSLLTVPACPVQMTDWHHSCSPVR